MALPILLFSAACAPAENFAWNSDINLKSFSDPANWHSDGGAPSHPPAVADDIVAPLLYGIVSFTGPQEVRNFNVRLDRKWQIIGKGALTVHGDFIKSGQDLILRDGNREGIDFDVVINGALTLESGILSFGQEVEHCELHAITVQGVTTVRDGALLFRSTDAELEGGLTMELGIVAVHQGDGPGGITVGGMAGGTEGTICASTSDLLQPAAVLTVNLPEGRTAAFGGVLQDGKGGTLALVKTGPGTQALTSAENTYSGGTLVEEGTLLVENGATGTGAVRVVGNGIFAGNGAIEGAVELAEQGVLSPGAEPGKPGTLVLKQGLAVKSDTALILLDVGARPEDGAAIKGEGDFVPGGRLVLVIAGQPASRKLFSGFSVRAGKHFAAVELDGAVKGRFIRNGDTWSAAAGGRRWAFSESSGVLSVAP